MIRCSRPIIVEGKYDKIKLSSMIDATIISTNGFAIFKDKEMLEMIRALAKKTGIIVLTDSDSAGFKIRNYIRSAVSEGEIINVYIPDVYGKEKRKVSPSKEGKLGVEGIDINLLKECFDRAGVFSENVDSKKEKITNVDLYFMGFSGTEGANEKRKKLLKTLGFPELVSTNALIPILNTLFEKEEFVAFCKDI